MNYNQVSAYILNTLPMFQRIGGQAYKADLENAFRLDKYFGHLHRNFKTIHVAGTNGKGSVCHMLASVLQESGYRTGLFTSPHLLDYRERIKVDGTCIPKKYITEFVNQHKNVFDEVAPLFFEMSVFLAFSYFNHCKVDIAVIEVGLGGRLDTTNIIKPEISVITNIGLDHTDILGSTPEEIAAEKAGIIKKSVPVVIGQTQPETKDCFRETAAKHSTEIYFSDQYFKLSYPPQKDISSITWHFDECYGWNFKTLSTDLKGNYQQKNLPAVLMTSWLLNEKGIKLDKAKVESGLTQVIENTGLWGRWQVLSQNPLVVCDTAHNPDGFKETTEQISSVPHMNLFMILGFVEDKKVKDILKLLPASAAYYLCAPDVPRAMKTEVVKNHFLSEGFNCNVFNTVSEAYIAVSKKTSTDDMIYIGGSTFVVADFLKWRKKKDNPF